ncbi:MAG: glycosyltransferase [Anaerostipes hadrus]|jgi:glycosyltransferase involved in cell wall biosynthesis|nr:MAG: glycosyltransferase [Anaerostipes hadrus]
MKKVMVLMATYNGQKYLEEQLQSLVKQQGVDIQILVRDDGSTDGTLEILNKWEKSGKIKWYQGKHLNAQYGFYDLMEHSKIYEVDYYAFCDQDDVWDEDKLSVAVTSLESIDTDIPSLYYCGQRLVDGNLKFLSDHTLNEERNLRTRFILSDIAGCTAVFNKALLYKILEYKPNYMLMHDTWSLKVCLALGGKVIIDTKSHMSYRQHGNNAVGLGKGMKANLRQVRQYISKYKVEEQMIELKRGYGEQIIPEYRKIVYDVCHYKKNWKCRRRLLNRSNIDFCNKGLNLTYFIKVMLNKL